ncbi:hypothetical protein D6D01_04258 [Aureobasidium pullulans]|uniref:Uncharacterized protein n=1 Tax=Aureobasidium pullulans TaxID=5580 RepID=A0A4S9LDC1_AURPU|nr:hypothetical protein D6D01_04258 [Aureobasidium pullulans]
MTMRAREVVEGLCILALAAPALDRAELELSTSRQPALDDGAMLWVLYVFPALNVLLLEFCVPGLRGRDDGEGEEGSGGCRSRFENLVHLVQGDRWTLPAHRSLEAEEASGEAVDSGDGRVVELMQSMRGCSGIMAQGTFRLEAGPASLREPREDRGADGSVPMRQ